MTDRMTNFLGIPIQGEINRGSKPVPQRPLSDLAPLMQVVLDNPSVGFFGWHQYTPYFNDGDPCVFSVHSLWAEPPGVTDEQSEGESDEDYDYRIEGRHEGVEYDKRWGKREIQWIGAKYETGPYEGPDEKTYDDLIALSQALEGGAFNDVLMEAFGDHAEIIVTPQEIRVEEYSHD